MEPARQPELSSVLSDRYTIHGPIASGGMAHVYLATDIRHGRKVAIKVMRRDTVGLAGQQRFMREISIAANLSHPNIIPLFDSGQSGGTLYFVMPLVEGPSLRDRLRSEGRLSLDETLTIAAAVGGALAHAHRQGVVHRDIKPGNILLDAGHARVADFGVSKAVAAAGGDELTTGEFTIGTASYMSPEQASAPATVDGRSDLYSLAVVVYEMLTGENPFRAATLDEVLARKALGTFRPLRELDDSIPTCVERAVSRALAPKPDQRFASVDEFVSALRGGPIAPVTAPSEIAVTAARSPRGSPLAAKIAAALVIGATAAVVAYQWPASASDTPAALGLGRIIVVPLYNGTRIDSLDDVGFAAGDWLTGGLQETGILEVLPATSAFEADSLARGPSVPTRHLAEETGAGTVVRGSYYRRGDSLLFQLEVSDQGGRRLAGSIADVTAPATDPMQGIRELRARLMGWLAVQYDERLQLPASIAARPPTYASYRALSAGMTFYLAAQNAQAWPLFLQAYALDSSFVRPLLYASLALTNAGDWHRADSLLSIVDRRRDSLNEYDRAWLDFRLAFVRGNVGATLDAMRRAARLAPGTKAAYNLAVAAFQAGHVHEALEAIQTLQPDRGPMRGFASYWSIYGSIVHALGDYDREYTIGVSARDAYPERLMTFPPLLRALAARGRLTELRDALADARRLPPDPYYWDYGLLLNETAEELRAHGHADEAATYWRELRDWLGTQDSVPRTRWRLVQTTYALGDLATAERHLATLRRASPQNVDYIGMSGLVAARRGDRAAALAIVDSLSERRVLYEFGAPSLYRARIWAALGDDDHAVAALEAALATGRPYQVWLHRDIDFERLRRHPAFVRLLRGAD